MLANPMKVTPLSLVSGTVARMLEELPSGPSVVSGMSMAE